MARSGSQKVSAQAVWPPRGTKESFCVGFALGERDILRSLHHVVAVVCAVAVDIVTAVVPGDADALVLLAFPLLATDDGALAPAVLIAPLPVRTTHHTVPLVQLRVVD